MNPKQALQILAQIAEPTHQHTNESGAAAFQATGILRQELAKLNQNDKQDPDDGNERRKDD